jgi:archaeal flagellin FlaB
MKTNRIAANRDQRGVTAIETAIILIAFVVVAAVFAFTVLSSGMNSTEKAKGAIAAGLGEVQSSMEVRGGVLALDTGTADGEIDSIVFNLATAANGDPVDLATGDDRVIVIDYRDDTQRVTNIAWTKTMLVDVNDDGMLDPRELAEITVPLSLTTALKANGSFVIEVKPPTGGIMVLERTCPPSIAAVNDLH